MVVVAPDGAKGVESGRPENMGLTSPSHFYEMFCCQVSQEVADNVGKSSADGFLPVLSKVILLQLLWYFTQSPPLASSECAVFYSLVFPIAPPPPPPREFYERLKAFVQSLDDETVAPADPSIGVTTAGGARSGNDQSRSSLEALKSRNSSKSTTEAVESTETEPNEIGPKETAGCSKSASVREEVA